MNRIRTVAVFPTMFTLGNLICGFFAIVVAARVDRPTSLDIRPAADIAFQHPTRVIRELDPTDDTHNIMLSGWLIFLAMVFDALDGHVARLARTTSDFGAQLDSLCDLVSFGVAPGFLLVKMCPTLYLFARQDLDHRGIVCGLRGAAAGAVQRRKRRRRRSHALQRFAVAGRRGIDRRLRHLVLRAAPPGKQPGLCRRHRQDGCKRCCRFSPCWSPC